jgi:hypothetical protein
MTTIRTAIVFLLVASSSWAQDAARMDEVVQSYVRDKSFMGTVLVARGGDVTLSKGYGSANLEWDIPNTPATKFRLGSITNPDPRATGSLGYIGPSVLYDKIPLLVSTNVGSHSDRVD